MLLVLCPYLGVYINGLKTGSVTELEKLPVHGSLVGLAIEPLLNR